MPVKSNLRMERSNSPRGKFATTESTNYSPTRTYYVSRQRLEDFDNSIVNVRICVNKIINLAVKHFRSNKLNKVADQILITCGRHLIVR